MPAQHDRPLPLIGTSPPRPDGLSKATGAAAFADDVPVRGLWYGATVRSPYARASIRSIGWDPGRAPAGAVCVTAGALPGPNGIRLVDDSWPILAHEEVRHAGEPVALVAARSREDARRACQAVEVIYDPLDPVLSYEEAAASPPLHAIDFEAGDVDAALAGAGRIVEGEYRTGLQEHLYIECQAVTAEWSGGAVSLHGTMQCPYYVHKAVQHAFGLSHDQVRVCASAVGGGFGGKEDYPSLVAVHAALLARAAGAPVRIVYDRHEDLIGTTKRHPSVVRHRTGVYRDGRLVAMEIDIGLDGGAYLTLSSVVLSRAVLHATGPYRCPNVRIRGVVRRTNTPPNGAFRGFGTPQVAFALERHMDAIAVQMGLDPYEIRARNAVVTGDRLPTGQRLDGGVAALECLNAVVSRTAFRTRWRENEARRQMDGGPLRGIGLSLYFHGNGFTGNGERQMQSIVAAQLLADGRIEVSTAATDMGQGSAIVLLQIAADAAGVTLDDVVFRAPDTALVPDSGPTVASRTTMIVGHTVALAVRHLRARVLDWWSAARDHEAHEVTGGLIVSRSAASVGFREAARRCVLEAGPITVTRGYEPPPSQVFDEKTFTGTAYSSYSWGADVVEVEVDPDTLEARAVRATAVCEVGTPIHPGLCRGQVEGGTLQAIGFGLMEDLTVRQGHYVNDRLSTYIIPTCKDAPAMEVELLQEPLGDRGAKGVGELPMDGAAPAVVAAIQNATGLRATSIPVTPERLFELSAGRS